MERTTKNSPIGGHSHNSGDYPNSGEGFYQALLKNVLQESDISHQRPPLSLSDELDLCIVMGIIKFNVLLLQKRAIDKNVVVQKSSDVEVVEFDFIALRDLKQ